MMHSSVADGTLETRVMPKLALALASQQSVSSRPWLCNQFPSASSAEGVLLPLWGSRFQDLPLRAGRAAARPAGPATSGQHSSGLLLPFETYLATSVDSAAEQFWAFLGDKSAQLWRTLPVRVAGHPVGGEGHLGVFFQAKRLKNSL